MRSNRSLALWLPVALAAGIGCYFSLKTEPSAALVYTAAGVAIAWALMAILFRKVLMPQRVVWLGGWAVALALLGFGVAGIKAEMMHGVRLSEEVGPIMLHGRVAAIEERTQGWRLVLEEVDLWKYPPEKTPPKLRIVVRTQMEEGIAPGDKIAVRVKLSPLRAPVYPGGFDFARMAYFQGIGASGFAVGPVRKLEESRGQHWMDRHRHRVTERITRAIGGGADSAIASMMITSEGGAIPEETLDSLRASGLAHILSVSGLHMVLAAAIAFVGVRGLLALTPLAQRMPVRKFAAGLAVAICGYYLLLAGSPVPAVRSYLMIALFFLAVMTDRVTTPLWPVALAAMALLIIWPESLLSASFQMSFAAVTALCAFFTREQEAPAVDGSLLWRYAVGIALSSLVAGFATAPFAIHHFGRFAAYGLLGNMMAMPITSFIIMPMGLLALLLMPLHLETVPLVIMGKGVSFMMAISDHVAALPFSSIALPQMGLLPLLLLTLGGLWLCIMRPLWPGFMAMAAAVVFYVLTPLPDVIIDGRGGLYAIREEGRLLVPDRARARYARENWMRTLGIEEAVRFDKLPPEHPLSACTKQGCRWQIKGIRFVYGEACEAADVLILTSDAACAEAGRIIRPADLKASGTQAIWVRDQSVTIRTVAEIQGRRWWTEP